jgi:pimeloyl-ACP methyl ester carboxylesterase/uncharacterized protein (DUF302 family)
MSKRSILFQHIPIQGLNIFYREAGPADGPVVLLLHGYPTSSFMFRNLIPLLSSSYRVIAPDLPGFGFSDAPAHDQFDYTFDHLASVMQEFIDTLELKRFVLYIFDYGAPVGLRLAMANPEKIAGLISQNGNAYEEGLSEGWNPVQRYWEEPTEANRYYLQRFLTIEATHYQYEHGASDPALIAPETITLDQHFLDRQGNVEIQLDLLKDYANNVRLYPRFQEYFRKYQPPTLAIWGNRDPYFLPAGAEGYRKDNPKAIVKFYETGHFALETHAAEIGKDILSFLHGIEGYDAVAPAGVTVRPAPWPAKESIDKLESFLQKAGVTIYARIDQQNELKKVGLTSGAIEFILFGNPKAGGPVMLESPIAALELPLKVVAYEDAQGKTQIAYNQGSYIRERYGLKETTSAPLNLDGMMAKVFGPAT